MSQYQPPQYPYPQQEQWPQQPYPPPPKQKKHPTGLWIGFGVTLVLLVIVAIINGPQGSNSTSTTSTDTTSQTTQPASQPTQPAATPTTAPMATPTPTPAHTFRTFGDGMFQVGKDIQPGTYRTRVGSTNCYYARLNAFDTTAIISNDNTDAPAVVTILATDTAFQSQNCGTWTNDLSAITVSKTSFSDGIFIVGTDIMPGTYRNSGSTGCYYARLSAFDTSAIISNDNTDAVAIVTIVASDKGFQSHNCGTWTKQ